MKSQPIILLAIVVSTIQCHPAAPNVGPRENGSRAPSVSFSKGSQADSGTSVPTYPPTDRKDVVETLHGIEVHDPYRWLEDSTNLAVRLWCEAEGTFARARLDGLPGRAALSERLAELTAVESRSLPTKRGKFYFVARRRANEQAFSVVVTDGPAGEERVLLDPRAWSATRVMTIGGSWPSPDGSLLLYSVIADGQDQATLKLVDVATGVEQTVGLPMLYNAKPQWSRSGRSFYYSYAPTTPTLSEAQRISESSIREHVVGRGRDDGSSDRVIREPTHDDNVSETVNVSWDGRWLTLMRWTGYSRTDIFVRDLSRKGEGWTPIATGRDALNAAVEWQDRYYLLTNDGAPRFHLFKVDPKRPERSRWDEIVAESPDAVLQDVSVIGDKLVLLWGRDATTRVELRDVNGTNPRELALPGLGVVHDVTGNPDESEGFFDFESPTTPRRTLAVDVRTAAITSRWTPTIPVDLSKFVVESMSYESSDGVSVPMLIVRARTTTKGQNPTILYAYGGFGINVTPDFNAGIIPWIERGGIFASANVRGGGERGDAWHRAAVGENKQKTVDDILAGARTLVRTGWTQPSKLVLRGGSNGGLMMAAAMVKQPAAIAAAILRAPLADMVRYPRFGDGASWVEEYGSPEVPAQLRALLGYSPYHNVKDGVRYPAVLIQMGNDDERTGLLHGRKLAAALQHATTGGVVLLSTAQRAGHNGNGTVSAWVDTETDALSFAASSTGLRF